MCLGRIQYDANINYESWFWWQKAFEDFCSSVGLTASAALNMFVKATLREGQIPFAIKSQKFNSKVEKAIQEADEIENGRATPKVFKDSKSLFEELDKEWVKHYQSSIHQSLNLL